MVAKRIHGRGTGRPAGAWWPNGVSARFSDEQFELLDKTAGDLDVSMAGTVADAGGRVFAEADRAGASAGKASGEWRTVSHVMGANKKKVASLRQLTTPKKLLLKQYVTNIAQKKREVNKGVTCGSITKRLTPPRR